MDRIKDDYPNAQYDDRRRWKRTEGRKIFHKQSAIRNRGSSQSGGGHWMTESYHWHLDVTFREDGNHTLEKQAAYNLNIIRKLCLNILKLAEVRSNALSLKKRRFAIGTDPEKQLEKIMEL